MTLYPGCKLNLGLSVLSEREDGFHDIETLLVPYEGMCDRIVMKEAPEFGADIDYGDCAERWPVEKDLAVRAFLMLQDEFGLPPVHISLKKGAPVGAGLASGSSDAVAALKLTDALFSLRLGEDRLRGYASRLGSDCAFFISGEPAIATGKGDRLEPYPVDLSRYRIKVVVPEGIRVNTAEAYAEVGVHSGEPLREALSRPVEQWRGHLVNDFEKSVFARYPELGRIKDSLYEEGAVYASMSGSGSAVYGLFERDEEHKGV